MEVSRDEFLRGVKELIATNRGRELPGTYNPATIGRLFRNQSKPWRWILERWAVSILEHARDAVRVVLEHILDEDVAEGVFHWMLTAGVDNIERAF